MLKGSFKSMSPQWSKRLLFTTAEHDFKSPSLSHIDTNQFTHTSTTHCSGTWLSPSWRNNKYQHQYQHWAADELLKATHTPLCVHFFSLTFSPTIIKLNGGGGGVGWWAKAWVSHTRFRHISIPAPDWSLSAQMDFAEGEMWGCYGVVVDRTVRKKSCNESSSSIMYLFLKVCAYMCTCISYKGFIYCTLLLTSNYVAAYVHSRDFHARSALSVHMLNLVVLRAVIGCVTPLTCSHMDSCFVTASSFQSVKTTEMPSNKTRELHS